MKKLSILLICMFAMLAAGTGLRAQQITITLNPGWTWISYPNAEIMQVSEALGGFVPMEGDMIASKSSATTYVNGRWRGGITQFMPGWGYKYYSKRTEDVEFVFARPASSSVSTAAPTDITAVSAVVGGTVTIGEGNHIFARGVCWGLEPNPTIDGSHYAGDNVAGSQSFTLNDLSIGTTYYVRAYAVTDYGLAYGEELSFTTEGGGTGGDHAYVDLGLPSGLLWATSNVGADNPEEYGDYFSWGETTTKDTYDYWNSYQYCNGSYNTLIKYCNNSSFGYNGFTDNLTTLLPEDDAATANWGDNWRMPTKEEFQELYYNTTVTWTTQNGVMGRLFTAANGNSLFLPAAGCHNENGLDYSGSGGLYWSSSLDMDYPDSALNFIFDSDVCFEGSSFRYLGLSVRPVRSRAQNTSFIIDATANPAEGGEVSGGGSYQEGDECTLTAMANTGYTFTNWTENDEVVSTDATYTFTVNTGRTLVANFTYSEGTGDTHAYVDLGLPSGLLWATCNVGADNPEDYGDYFAWGETTPKDTYNWSTYQYCNGSENTLTKYCSDSYYGYNGFTDNLTTLLPEDDAATANWGNGWRMPTETEWMELLDNTTVIWTTQNGVYGRLFISYNGNSLFLPAAGYRDDSSFTVDNYCGHYWSNSLLDQNFAWIFEFNWGDGTNYYMGDEGRYCGLSVRPVRVGSQNNIPTGAIDSKFTINEDGDQVYFSKGNLQYQASMYLWKFAENQYDYVGSDNSNISSTYDGWIDLFGWGTSGWNSGNTYYHPWDSNNSNGSLYGPLGQYNLTGSYAFADWGVYNLISNGGYTVHWRTLTQPEWNYVFNTRTTTSGIRYAKANVNNVNGVVLLPDDWSSSTYSLSNTNNSEANFSSNTLTASQWNTLKQTGAVFLPAAGIRNGTSVYNVGSDGYYWSASYSGSDDAHDVYFGGLGLGTNGNYGRYFGLSVRLVAPVEN